MSNLKNPVILKHTGFTMVELLVVVTIITVLATMALVNYREFLKRGRDTKRQSDLRTVQSALEQYRSDNGTYPLGIQMQNPDCSSLATGEFAFGCPFKATIGTSTRIYLNEVPREQISSPYLGYKYTQTPTSCNATQSNPCKSYCLYVSLEGTPPPISSPPALCIDYPIIYNFVATPP